MSIFEKLVLCFVIPLTFVGTAGADTDIYITIIGGNAVACVVELDPDIANVCFATIHENSIDVTVNGQDYTFSQLDMEDGYPAKTFLLFDGGLQSDHIQVNGNSGVLGTGIVTLLLFGDASSDVIINNTGNPALINGGLGDDILLGGSIADRIHGSGGNDAIEGGDGPDLLFGEGDDDSLLGQGGDDTLAGGNGADRINGGAGNDALYGGGLMQSTPDGDIDQLTGGGDTDVFHHAWYGWKKGTGIFWVKVYREVDLITDFESGIDFKVETLYPFPPYAFK